MSKASPVDIPDNWHPMRCDFLPPGVDYDNDAQVFGQPFADALWAVLERDGRHGMLMVTA